MRLGITGWIIAAVVLFVGRTAFAQTAEQLLNQLKQIQQQQSYQGSFIYERKDVFSTHRMWRLLTPQGQKKERFLQLDGSRFEAVRVDGQVQCITLADGSEQSISQVWPEQTFDTQQLAQWYALKVLGQSRVADRAAVAILFAPLDQYRYPLELHLDQQTGAPLKSLLLNEDGLLLERFQFVDFSADAVQAADFNTDNTACVALKRLQATTGTAAPSWQIEWLPPGFVAVQATARNWNFNEHSVTSQSFSDGLAHFSVFVEHLGEQAANSARHQVGPTAVVSRKLETEQGAYMLTVLGEIPAGTAERIALSIRLSDGD